MRNIILIVHDIRSTHNVGALLRTADGLGVNKVYLTGYTPHPHIDNDDRLPHIVAKLTRQINKTALGAETSVDWEYHEDIVKLIESLKRSGYTIAGLEQSPDATPLPKYQPPENCALLIGREVEGIDPALLTLCDDVVEIPMYGSKESFNVVHAAAITLYTLRES